MSAESALRGNVRLLGNILGATLVEQHGTWLLDLVEHVRALAGAGRSGDAAAGEELARLVEGLPLDQQSLVLRSFALYFQLANISEQHHRLRRRRRYEHEGRVPRETVVAERRGVAPAPVDDPRVADEPVTAERTYTTSAGGSPTGFGRSSNSSKKKSSNRTT